MGMPQECVLDYLSKWIWWYSSLRNGSLPLHQKYFLGICAWIKINPIDLFEWHSDKCSKLKSKRNNDIIFRIYKTCSHFSWPLCRFMCYFMFLSSWVVKISRWIQIFDSKTYWTFITFIFPSIFYDTYLLRVVGKLEPIPVDYTQGTGWQSITGLTHRQSFTFTPMGN